MAQRGGISHINYRETRGLKVSDGQFVKKGTILTRQGDKWKAGINVAGRSSIYAICDGKVFFSKKRGSYHRNKITTLINVKELKPAKKATQ